MKKYKSLITIISLSFFISCSQKNESNPAPNPEPTTVKDIDGNIYNTVKIGSQVWMKENLKVSKFRTGDVIPKVSDQTDWSAIWNNENPIPAPAWCNYENDWANNSQYGKLYNWYTVADQRGLCPTGWHIPTSHDWSLLIFNIDNQEDTSEYGANQVGIKLKAKGTIERGTGFWKLSSDSGSNETGFSGLPGGGRSYGGYFDEKGTHGCWWTSTESSSKYAWAAYLNNNSRNLSRSYGYGRKAGGYSVRCVKD